MQSTTGIKDTFTVMLRDKDHDGSFRRKFGSFIQHVFAGDEMMTVKANNRQIEAMAEHEQVALIEQEYLIHTTRCATQRLTCQLWNKQRIQNRTVQKYRYNLLYQSKVDAYVLDTGVQHNYEEFGDRLKEGFFCTAAGCTASADVPGRRQDARTDRHGHGSHVAGTLAGHTYGVAQGINVIPVKMADHDGGEGKGKFTFGTVANALITARNRIVRNNKVQFSVINLSLSGPHSRCFNKLVNKLYKEGITVVVAAGNDGSDACDFSPASARGAITVGSIDVNNAVSGFSNKGNCVDIYAPGEGIYSVDGKGHVKSWSGTSMAAPHVAGAAALMQGKRWRRGGLHAKHLRRRLARKYCAQLH